MLPTWLLLQLLMATAVSHKVQVFVWERLLTLAELRQHTAVLPMTTATMMCM